MGRRGKKKVAENAEEANTPKVVDNLQSDRDRNHESNNPDDRWNNSWEEGGQQNRNQDSRRRDFGGSRNYNRFDRGGGRQRGGRAGRRGNPRNHQRFDDRDFHNRNQLPRYFEANYDHPSMEVRSLRFEENTEPSSVPALMQMEVSHPHYFQQPVVGRDEPEPKVPETPNPVQENNIVTNVAPEKPVSPKKKAEVPPSTPTVANIKKEKTVQETSSESSSDSEEEEVATLKAAKNIKKEPVEKKLPAPTSSESSEFESDSEEEKKSEEDLVCLGNVELFEDLVSDDSNSKGKKQTKGEKKEVCLLCDKKGHVSFNCMMICKNCGEKYHNLKACPKPPNLSIMLQYFLEFCMSQCSQYNPEQRFQFNNGLIQGQMLPGCNPMDADSNSQKNGKKRLNKKADTSSDSDSDSSRATSSTKRKRKKKKTSDSDKMAFGPFAPAFANGNFNPMNMMALGQMMGFNPMAYSKK